MNKIVIITITKNEESYIEKYLQSVVSSTVTPLYLFIYDDHSTDSTVEIIRKYAKYPFIKIIDDIDFVSNSKSTGFRVGSIFNEIYTKYCLKLDYDILIKFDSDISFSSTFVENILEEFHKNDRLGIASGNLVQDGKVEKIGKNYTRGATMFYRKRCWEEIGGLIPNRGEDTTSAINARSFGWMTEGFPVEFNHNKPEGIKLPKFYKYWEMGVYKGELRYYLPFFIGTIIRDIFRYPPILSSCIQVVGYLVGLLKKSKYNNRIIRQIRKEQKEIFSDMLTKKN